MAESKEEKKGKKVKSFFEDYQNLYKMAKRLEKTAENPFFKSKYVQLKDVLSAAKELCAENNFVFIQMPKVREDGIAILETELIHKGGTHITAQTLLPCKDSNDPQKYGGAITYMRRYSLTAILGLEEEDDDGNNASKSKKGEGKKTEASEDTSGQYKVKCMQCGKDFFADEVWKTICPACYRDGWRSSQRNGDYVLTNSKTQETRNLTKEKQGKVESVDVEKIPFKGNEANPENKVKLITKEQLEIIIQTAKDVGLATKEKLLKFINTLTKKEFKDWKEISKLTVKQSDEVIKELQKMPAKDQSDTSDINVEEIPF